MPSGKTFAKGELKYASDERASEDANESENACAYRSKRFSLVENASALRGQDKTGDYLE